MPFFGQMGVSIKQEFRAHAKLCEFQKQLYKERLEYLYRLLDTSTGSKGSTELPMGCILVVRQEIADIIKLLE